MAARYKALVFDFDGTIADTLGEARRIFNEMAPDYGLRGIEEGEMEGLRHMTLKQFIEHMNIPKRRLPGLLARGTGMMRSSIANLRLIEGMGEVIVRMRKEHHSFGILTSNAPANVDLFLKAHGLRGHFDFISSTSKLTGKSKHLKAIRKTFSLDATDILYVGDELRDVKASKKAGIPVAAVTWGFNSRESLAGMNPEHLFTRPDEFLQLLGPEAPGTPEPG
jgi:phosphoglycolate phosphatase